MPLYLDDTILSEELSIEPWANNNYDIISITSYLHKDKKYILKKCHFENMNDEDMQYIKDMLVLKVQDKTRGGWRIDAKKKKILIIKWDSSNKTYDIIYRRRISDSWEKYNTYKTSNMKHLAISATKLKKYKEMKT
jgi:hypothetical protein